MSAVEQSDEEGKMIVPKIQLVFSNPAPGREDEFNEWYSSRHVHEIPRVPGYESAQRYRVTRHRLGGSGGTPEPFRYLALGDKVVRR